MLKEKLKELEESNIELFNEIKSKLDQQNGYATIC